MFRWLLVLATAAMIGVLPAGCDSSSKSPPPDSANNPSAVATSNGRGGGLTLPKDAPPRVRKAVEKAKSAEDERDRIQAKALEIIREHPPPDVPVNTLPSGPAHSAEPCADGSVDASCDPSSDCVSGCLPSSPAEPQPNLQPPPVPAVPPEVRVAMNDWARAQRERIKACEEAAAEMQHTDDSGIGTSTSPLCGADQVPEDFKKWLAILGYDVNDLLYKGV